VRLAHAENNDEGTCRRFADGEIAAHAHVVTDRHAGYNQTSLGPRPHEAVVQSKAQRRKSDAVQVCHWTISLLKRWLVGTHAGAARPKHLQAYLDEFAFRHNRRKTSGVARIAAASSKVSLRDRPSPCANSSTPRFPAAASTQIKPNSPE
jgi:hypothetical protein